MIKKSHKKISSSLTYSNHLLKFGSCGFKVISALRLTKEELVSLERIVVKKLKNLSSTSKNYKFWNLLKPNQSLTKLNLESRMGKGKGAIYTEVLFLKGGSIIYEFQNIAKQEIKELLHLINKQLSVKLILILKK